MGFGLKITFYQPRDETSTAFMLASGVGERRERWGEFRIIVFCGNIRRASQELFTKIVENRERKFHFCTSAGRVAEVDGFEFLVGTAVLLGAL